jgi:hypothetical protein
MAKGVRLSASTLVARYRMPEATARAVEELADAKVDVTDEVARLAGSDPGVAELLAAPGLRSDARSLTTENLHELRTDLGVSGTAAALIVVPKRTWRTIALQEEEGGLPVLAPAAASTPMKPSELRTLFSPEEVKRLKLEVLTSADATERITAIRRLGLAPGTTNEKGAVLLAALADDDPKVRLEAIRALVPLGLNPDIGREARYLVSGTDKQKLAAARQMGELAGSASPGEISVLLTLIAGTLNTELPADARRALVESLLPAADAIANEPGQLAGAVGLLAEQLTERPVELVRPVRRVLAALGARDADGTVTALEAEIDRVPDPEARRRLLGAFSSVPVPEGRRPAIARRMAGELLSAPEPETDCIGMANALCGWGATAVDALLEVLGQSLRQQKTFILRVLDNIASRRDCPVKAKQAVTERFLNMLKTDTRPTQAVLLESELFGDRALPKKLKAGVARELVLHVHEFGGPRMIGTIEDTVIRLGAAAIDPLLELVTEGVRDRDRVSAARVLGHLVAGLPGQGARNADQAVNALMRCVRLLDEEFPDRNVLAEAIGEMCTSPAMPADTVRRVGRGLRVRVGKEPYSFGLLGGLGRLAASPNVELQTRIEVADSLLRLLEVDLPDMQSKRFTGGEKTIFIAGDEAAAYTDMIPILLDGLRTVCVNAGSSTLRDRIVAALIDKWREASSWRLVWGPANTLKLAEVLGEIARADNADRAIRAEIAEALVTSSDLLPVVRVLGPVLELDSGSAAMGKLAARVGARLLERMAPGSGDRFEVDEGVTAALGSIAARRHLGPKDTAARLRRAIAEVLFKALRNGAPGAAPALRKLAESAAVPRPLRREIEARLERR